MTALHGSIAEPVAELLASLERALPEMTSDLQRFVEFETPSDDKGLLDSFARLLTERARSMLDCEVSLVRRDDGGDHVVITTPGSGPRVLVVGHFDTVWPRGTFARMGFVVDGAVARGPGVFDMKGGLVEGLWALRALQDRGLKMPPIEFLCTSDEEIGSPGSRSLIEELGRAAELALVLEPSADGGALKTARKGVGLFEVQVTGRASHAGLAPEAGVSAVSELAHIITELGAAGNAAQGTSVNVGRIGGGTRPNVVAAEAWCEVDVRVVSPAEVDRIESVFAGLRPHNPAARVRVTGEMNRGPLVRTAGTVALLERARLVARALGRDLAEASVGGGSDGNLVAAVGTPVLDGLGPVGGGAHAVDEWISLGDMAWRTALLAGLITSLATAPMEINRTG